VTRMNDRQRAVLAALIEKYEQLHGRSPGCILAHQDAYCMIRTDIAHGRVRPDGRLHWKGIEVKGVDRPGNAVYLAGEPEYFA